MLHYSPPLKKICVRQVVLDKWFPPVIVIGQTNSMRTRVKLTLTSLQGVYLPTPPTLAPEWVPSIIMGPQAFKEHAILFFSYLFKVFLSACRKEFFVCLQLAAGKPKLVLPYRLPALTGQRARAVIQQITWNNLDILDNLQLIALPRGVNINWVGNRSPAKRMCRILDCVKPYRPDDRTITAIFGAKHGRKEKGSQWPTQ